MRQRTLPTLLLVMIGLVMPAHAGPPSHRETITEWLGYERAIADYVAELNLAGRTPRQHLRGPRLREALDGAQRIRVVTAAHLQDSTAARRSAVHFVAHLQSIQRIQAQQSDVRRLQEIAPGVENELWRLAIFRVG